MNNEEIILQAITRMDERMGSIETKIDSMDKSLKTVKKDIKEIKAVQETHTTALNELLGWADAVAIETKVPFAQPKKLAEAK